MDCHQRVELPALLSVADGGCTVDVQTGGEWEYRGDDRE